MTPQEAGLTNAIQAERPETLYHLRRQYRILAGAWPTRVHVCELDFGKLAKRPGGRGPRARTLGTPDS